MANVFERLRRKFGREPKDAARRDRRRRRRESDYYESSYGRDVEEASPERAGELAGHPIERRDT